jgi:hypothetical protein
MSTRPLKPVDELNAADYDTTRYNGGWTKSVTGLDKSKSNGYSIKGTFMRRGSDIYVVGGLYLDCDIQGSRKNQEKRYRLFRVQTQGIDVLESAEGRSWATDLWPAIEDALGTAPEANVADLVEQLALATNTDPLAIIEALTGVCWGEEEAGGLK